MKYFYIFYCMSKDKLGLGKIAADYELLYLNEDYTNICDTLL